jgi:hypothetical protein
MKGDGLVDGPAWVESEMRTVDVKEGQDAKHDITPECEGRVNGHGYVQNGCQIVVCCLNHLLVSIVAIEKTEDIPDLDSFRLARRPARVTQKGCLVRIAALKFLLFG